MIESEVVKEWQAEAFERGRAEGRAEAGAEGVISIVIAMLEGKFENVPPEVEAVVRGCFDLAKLRTWAIQVAFATTLDGFRTAASI